MWRWSSLSWFAKIIQAVFSTYVEVILKSLEVNSTKSSILHVCGGDPVDLKAHENNYVYSPRMWRWSRSDEAKIKHRGVFSTYVEVILPRLLLPGKTLSILHVCGGDPQNNMPVCLFNLYSPRMWRWSWAAQKWQCRFRVFSTYVEVILLHSEEKCLMYRILHVCGGDPKPRLCKRLLHWYSPRMWRWSLCNDLGLFNGGSILHVCGGDPQIRLVIALLELYSPRMWRWSFHQVGLLFAVVVFSTYVEVILSQRELMKRQLGILHVCGGDPTT